MRSISFAVWLAATTVFAAIGAGFQSGAQAGVAVPPLSFGAPIRLLNGYSLVAVVAGDFNGDGITDLAVGSNSVHPASVPFNNHVLILLGNGDGTFKTPIAVPLHSDIRQMAIGDVNHDGRPDLIVTTQFNGDPGPGDSVEVLLGRGDGTFLPPLHNPVDSFPWSVAVADLDGDGNPDLLVDYNGLDCGGLGKCVAVFKGNGDGTFTRAASYNSGGGNALNPLYVADVDHDGRLDVLVGTFSPPPYLLFGQPGGSFGPPTAVAGSGAFTAGPFASAADALLIDDFNGDGKADIGYGVGEVVGSGSYFNSSAWFQFGLGDGTFRQELGYEGGIPFASRGSTTQAIAKADFDGDGAPDVALVSWEGHLFAPAPGMVTIMSQRSGQFGVAARFPVPSFYASAVLAPDLNGDGKPDLVIIESGSTPPVPTGLTIYLNTTVAYGAEAGAYPHATHLSYTGVPDGESAESRVAAVLTDSHAGIPVAGATITFNAGAKSCTDATNTHGEARCSIVGLAPGNYVVTAQFGDDGWCPGSATCRLVPAQTSGHLEVKRSKSLLLVDAAQVKSGKAIPPLALVGRPVELQAVLMQQHGYSGQFPCRDPRGTAITGRSIQLELAGGGVKQACTGISDSEGVIKCSINPVTLPTGPATITGRFVGDTNYDKATDSIPALVAGPLTRGTFVIGSGPITLTGDVFQGFRLQATTLTVGKEVTFWSQNWAQSNPVNAGTIPAGFNGYAETCGLPCFDPTANIQASGWTSTLAASLTPPGEIPSYMPVAVTSELALVNGPSKDPDPPGPLRFQGTIFETVIVRVTGGGSIKPGQPATGTIVRLPDAQIPSSCDITPAVHGALKGAWSGTVQAGFPSAYSLPYDLSCKPDFPTDTEEPVQAQIQRQGDQVTMTFTRAPNNEYPATSTTVTGTLFPSGEITDGGRVNVTTFPQRIVGSLLTEKACGTDGIMVHSERFDLSRP